MNAKKWSLIFVSLYGAIMLLIGGTVVIVDPFFHYHKPLRGISYSFAEEEYVNNGIIRNFDYDAMIVGTSMTKAFKTSEADQLFDRTFIRITNQGEGYKVINQNIELAIQCNPDLDLIIRSIDAEWFISSPDWLGYDEYPEYLYDDNIWNDVEYLYNKEILERDVIPTIQRSISGVPMDQFDNYGIGKRSNEGKAIVLNKYERPAKENLTTDEEETKQYFNMLKENIDRNVVSVIEDNPDISFYLFIPPYSICWWDSLHQKGGKILERRLDMEAYVLERLLAYDNVHMFSFNDNFEMICDLNNYIDTTHYADEINSQILVWMKEGKYQLTEKNYKEYLAKEREFYCNYNYDSIFSEEE